MPTWTSRRIEPGHSLREQIAALKATGMSLSDALGREIKVRMLDKGSAAKALSQGAMTCNSGYYHGVIEHAFAGVDDGEAFELRSVTV